MWLTVHEDRWSGPWRVVTVTGEIDLATAPRLRDRLADVLHRSGPRVILDLARVTFCDSSGLAAFLGIARRARLLGGDLLLAAPTAQIRKALHVTGLDQELRILPAATPNAGDPVSGM